jgi:hypothetical protein
MKHDFNVVMQVQPLETAFYRDSGGKEHLVEHTGQGLEFTNFDGYHITRHEFEKGETVHPDEATAMICARCGCTVWIQGSDLDFAQECSERQGVPSCESQYVIDIMTS